MKKFIIFFFLICVKTAVAQVVPDSVDLRSSSYSITIDNDTPLRNKYQIARKWFAANFQNYRDIVVSDDARNCKIVMKPLVLYKADQFVKCFLATELTFECTKNQFTLKFDDVRKRSVFTTMANLERADSIYIQSKRTTDRELWKFHRYQELKAKTTPTSDERIELNRLSFFEKFTEEAVRDDNMKSYTDMQKIVAEIVNMLKLTIEDK